MDGDRRERLRDRADAVLRVRGRRLAVPSASASPTASCQTSSPRRKTAALTLGSRFSDCRPARTRRRSAASVRPRARTPSARGIASIAALDVVVGDVEVRDRAEHRRAARSSTGRRARACRASASCAVSPSGPTSTCTKFVSTCSRSTGDAGRGERLGQAAGARVVLGEPIDVVVERVDAGGRDDPGLAHRAAEAVLAAAGLRHRLARAREEGAERAAEALREAERDRVEASRRSRRPAPRVAIDCVEQPRAVEVDDEVELARASDDLVDLVERPAPARRTMLCVFSTATTASATCASTSGRASGADVLAVKRPASVRSGRAHEAGVHRRAALLGEQDVRVLLREQLVAGLARGS